MTVRVVDGARGFASNHMILQKNCINVVVSHPTEKGVWSHQHYRSNHGQQD